MKIITRAVLDWNGNVLEEESYEYAGEVAHAGSSGAQDKQTVQTTEPWQAQQPFLRDIFQQAQAQFQGPGGRLTQRCPTLRRLSPGDL